MASITRSGRGLKHGGTTTTKIGSVPAEVAKRESTSSKIVNAKNKVGINNDDKTNMMSTGTVAIDAYNLRKSCRETPKKSTTNLGLTKPVKPKSSVSSIPNKKRPHSPLRRSERIEKIGVSSSPNAKKSVENMTPSKKRKTDVNDSKNKKLDMECEDTSKKKKTLLARSYVRSIFASDDNEISDDEGAHLEDDAPTKDASANLSLSTLELHVGSDECNSSKEDKYCGENNDDSSKVFGDDSCSGSRELDIQRNPVHKSGKKYEENPSNSNHILSSSNFQSEEETECTKYTDIIHDSHKLVQEDSKVEDRLVIVVNSLERAGNSTGLENETTNAGHSSTLLKSGNTDICTIKVSQASTDICTTKVSEADTTSLLPNHDSGDDIRSHTTCNKIERGTFGVRNGTSNSKENRIENQNESLAVVQTDGDSNACKQSGNLLFLCCGGKNCQEKYHLSCLSPPLQNIPSGIWLCGTCVKKKVELGVHSVSQGIESIWDVKEEVGKGKVYLVKYAGFAHVHNQWVAESQLLSDAVDLIDKFNKKGKKGMATRWKQEWTVPQRILQKRLLTPTSIAGARESLHYYTEYLVKWKCLGYDNATWELEKEPFICVSFGKKLISDFENRIKEAKKASDPSRVRTVQLSKKNSLHKLSRIPDDWPIGVDNVHLNTVNQLLERWHNSHHAVLNVDQERIIKSILFLSAIKPYTCQPVLVVSTVHSLSLWEAEFARLAPSINVVVYTGNKDTRKLIRNLEFYEDSGCIMFQVLLSHPNAIIEDFDALDSVGWEMLVVDDCQHPRVSNHLETFKNISTKFRLLLLNSQLKDNDAEYLNLLSLLDSGGKENSSINSKYNLDGTLDTLTVLKKKLACYLIEHIQKSKLSKFIEYWVPVHLSNVQLEQYCSTLVSNSIILQSSIKNDHVGALRDILISTRKCCDHPYLVSQSLPSFLSTHLPLEKYLDVGVMASSKLHLLDRFLHEIKKKELRGLILYQSIGQVRDSIGDILDDFISQRFGSDSFERVDSGLQSSRKLAALNKFNDKANRRFVFLLESHACLPSIKLSSVDVVVIFDSDWNPLNDLKALQKIQIDSQSEYITVFRLYVSRTIEEKVLIFAKQDTVLDSHIQGLSPGNSHLLLSWGANYLFSQLDEFHRRDRHEYSEMCINTCFFDESASKFLDDVIIELVNCLSRSAKENLFECLFLIKAHQNGASYSKNIKLAGEKDGMSSFDNDPSVSWSNIFQNKRFNWKFITSEPSQRSRRKAQLFCSSLNTSEMENEERKRRRKLSNEENNGVKVPDDVDLSQPQLVSSTMSLALASKVLKKTDGMANHATRKCPSSSKPENIVECQSKHNEQGDLYLHLKPKLSELSDTLKLPDEVKSLAHVLLEYIMNNHSVNRDSEAIVQSLVLSLCWRAASLLKHKLDRRECLALANKYLKYTCSEEEANSVYRKLHMLKKKFSQLPTSEHEIEPGSVGKLFSASEEDNPLEMKDVSDEHKSSESKEGSTPGRVSKPNILESRSSAFGEADYPQHIKEDFNDDRSSENNEVLVFRCENLPKTFGNQSEPRDTVVHQSNTKKNPTSSESQEIPSSRREYEPCKNHSSTLKESDDTSVVSRKTNVASDQNLGHLKDILLKKRIDLVQMVSSTREKTLKHRQQEERSDFNVQRETERILMNKLHDAQIDLIRSVHVDHTIRSDKISLLNLHFVKKMAEYDEHMQSEHKKLIIMQESAMNKENEIRDLWLEDARAGTLVGSFDTLPSTETGFMLEKFKGVSEVGNADDLMSSLIRAKAPNALITEHNSELSSTPRTRISTEMPRSTEPYNACADIPGSTSSIVSSSVVELHPAGPSKTCYEIHGSTLDSTVSTPAEAQLEPNKNCSEITESSLLPIPLTVVEEEAAQPNRILDDILESSSNPTLYTVADMEPIEQNQTCAETLGMSSDLLPSSAEADTIGFNRNCSEIPKSTSDPITSSIEVESNEKNRLCNTNSGLTSDPSLSIDAATALCKMVDETPRSISDNLPASIVEKVPTEPNRKGGEVPVLTSVLTFDTIMTISPVGPTEIPDTDRNIDPSKARTENLVSKTDSIPSSTIQGELTESNRTCAETPGSISGLACNNATIISSDDPITAHIEAREIVVSSKTDETHMEIPTIVLPAIDVGILVEEVPIKTAVNETVAERVSVGMVAVEPIGPHENSTENLTCESIPLIKENEIIASESIDVVEERVDPNLCPVKNLGIPKKTEGLPSHNIIESALKQTDASDELSLEEEVPSKTTENEIVAKRITNGMVAMESIEPLENFTENLAPESIPLTKENEIPASELIDMVQERVGVESSSYPVENLDILKETGGLPSHNIVKSAIEQTDASDEQIICEGENTVCDHEIRLTSLQTEDELPTTMHLEMDLCTATSNTDSAHEKDNHANLGSPHVEISVDDYLLTENAPANSPQPPRIEEHIVDTISNMFNASVEKRDQLAIQPILPLPPSSEAEVGTRSSNSHGELTAQQLTVQESIQVHQSNVLSPQPILHLSPLTESEVIDSLNLQRNMPAQPPVVNKNLQAGPSNLSLPSILHSPPVEADLRNELLCQQSNQLTSHPIMHPPPPFENVGTPNSESVLPVQRPILNESLHVDQPIVSGYQSSEQSPSLPATSLPGRTQTEVNAGTSVLRQTESHGIQFLPITSLIHPQALHDDPLQNELTRIRKQSEIRRKMHEDKRLERKKELEEELEKVRKKYEALIQEDESEYNQDKKYLDTIYSKVLINRILAEEFRSKFIERPSSSSFPRGPSSGPVLQSHQSQMMQVHTTSPAPIPSPRTSSAPPAPRPSVPPAPRPSAPPAPRPSVPPAPRPPPIQDSYRAPQPSNMSPFGPPVRYTLGPSSLGPSNTSTPPPGLVHTTPSVIPTIPNLRPPPSEARTTPAPRAPAPHLHRYRPPPSSLPSSSPPPIAISSLSSMAVQPMDTTASSIGKLINMNPPDPRAVMPSTNLGSNRLTVINEAPPPATATTSAGDDVVCLSDDE